MVVLRLLLVLAAARGVFASESDALAISADIQARHLPFGTILDPIFASPSSNQIIGYTRCGDSALWTGAWLAAEAYRYKVTQSPAALAAAQKALAGLKSLSDVTGTNLLARCIVQSSSPFAQGIASEEKDNGIHPAAPWFWVGHTSRDQFIGVIFGLGAAYDLIDDTATKANIADLVTRLTGFLTGHAWNVVMPDGSISTTFLIRPDETLAILQVAKHVNPSKFSSAYSDQKFIFGDAVPLVIGADIISDDSYFKFNLAYMSLYNLIRLESGSYRTSYNLLRGHTQSQQNAFFNLIDQTLQGPNAARDAETRSLLEQWLRRPRRDVYMDASKSVANCGDQACVPVPLRLRPATDFIWQRSPFQLAGGGSGIIEGAGIDYILPYWMARYYGVMGASPVTSTAANSLSVAPNSIASLYGSGLASPVTVTDSAGVTRTASSVYTSSTQMNFIVPAGTAPGIATFRSGGQTSQGTIQNIAPTLFSIDTTGTGVAAATALRVQASNPSMRGPVPVFFCASSGCFSAPIQLGVDTPVYVSLYGTGIRGASALSNVRVTVDGISVPVLYAGAQTEFPGLDQVNISLPLSLRGAGESNVVLTVDGQTSNTVTINVQ